MIFMMPSNLETMSSSSNGSVEMKKTVLSPASYMPVPDTIGIEDTSPKAVAHNTP